MHLPKLTLHLIFLLESLSFTSFHNCNKTLAARHQLFKQPVHVLLRQIAALQQNFAHRKDLTVGQLADLCIQSIAAKPLVINDRLVVVLFLKEVAQRLYIALDTFFIYTEMMRLLSLVQYLATLQTGVKR